jgi:hypothetical protein
MTAVMPIDEPRPRGTLLGERADRRRVHEVEYFFRCKACNGWIDARDMGRGPRRPVAAPRAGSISIGCAVDQRRPCVPWFGAAGGAD